MSNLQASTAQSNLIGESRKARAKRVSSIDKAAHEAATSPKNDLPQPTEKQIESGNYRKGHIKLQGLDVTIENPRNSKRSGVDQDGKTWEVEMKHHYGYLKATSGADDEHIDVFIGKNPDSDRVFIIDQINQDGGFDEHKVMIGFMSKVQAKQGYKSNYAKGWKVGEIHQLSMDEFKRWLKEADLKKPYGAEAA